MIPPQTQTRLIRANTPSLLRFVFDKLPKPRRSDDIEVTVEIFGDFGDATRYADVFLGGASRQRIQGGEPTCNWARTPSHTGRYKVDPLRLLGGKLEVKVELSPNVERDKCVLLQSRVTVTLSYGGRLCCNQQCVQRKQSAQHCGTCGNVCSKGSVCCNGKCCEANAQCSVGECSRVLSKVGYWVHHIAPHPTQSLAALATSDGLELWNYSTGVRLFQVNQKPGVNTWGAAFHPKGSMLASASTDGVVRLWSMQGKPTKTLWKYPKTAAFVAFHPDGTRLASSSLEGRMHMWDITTGKELWTYKFGGTGIRTLLFDPKGRFLVVQAGASFVLLLDTNGKVRKAINMGRFSSSNVTSLAIRPDGAWIAVGMASREIHILELTNYTSVKVLANPGVPNKLTFDPSGVLLAAASSDKGIWVWRVTTAALHKSLFGHQTSVTSAAFHPSSALLLTGAANDKVLRLWNVNVP